MSSTSGVAIVWFRQDLRLADNPALYQALQTYDRIIPLYIHAPHEAAPWEPGAASNWWLHHSLGSLQQSLKSFNVDLVIKSGNSLEVLQEIIQALDVDAVYWNRLYEPSLIERDSNIKKQLKSADIDCRSFNANVLNEPHTILNKSGKPFKVFTAYWKTARNLLSQISTPLAAPQQINSLDYAGESISSLKLLPTIAWDKGFYDHWDVGEKAAQIKLDTLAEPLAMYTINRDFPAVSGTSKLSAHLHFGEVSPRQVFAVCSALLLDPTVDSKQVEKFLSEIGWREFAYYQLYHFPQSSLHALDSRYEHAWPASEQNQMLLEAWQKGQTGIPLVDAGMRELWHTGWMHNRVRMITASILTKNMGINWLQGARWFWDTLVDADLAANTMGWQWTAGCGVDAAPYFRIFSPQRQAERFDADAKYIRQWVPEFDPSVSDDYISPVIDLSDSRKAALNRWDTIKQAEKVSCID